MVGVALGIAIITITVMYIALVTDHHPGHGDRHHHDHYSNLNPQSGPLSMVDICSLVACRRKHSLGGPLDTQRIVVE